MKIDFNKSDRYLVMLFFIIALPVTFSGYDYSKGLFQPSMDTLIYFVFTSVLSYIIVYKFFPNFFPKQQLVKLFFWTVLAMSVFGVAEIFAYRMVEGQSNLHLFKRYELWFWGISSSTENVGILVGILLGKKFYDAQIDLKQREKEKKEAELRLLKSQIDPHFLFNNLNTVDSLIDTDPKTAKAYLNHLSKLYRYLIRTKDDEVVPLEEEINFAKNYMFLIEKRFGKAYQFFLTSGNDQDDTFLPPGSLQTVLENVVKHNKATIANPIISKISVLKDAIVIENNVNLKKDTQASLGTGLENLKARYNLLTDDKIEIIQNDHYQIILPIIKTIVE